MTRITLLEELKKFTETACKDLLQPYKWENRKKVKNPETGEMEEVREGAEVQPVKVFLHCLSDIKALRTAPCILHQIVTGKDFINERRQFCSVAVVRTGFCAYGENGESGELLLNIMERLRVSLLKELRLAQGQFMLDIDGGLETLVYPNTDETKPYALGEMISDWYIPPIKRELTKLL